jgi:dipeptidase E
MNLILSGGGNSEQSKDVDTLFTSLLKNNKVLYIPIAMDRVKHPDRDCLLWLENNLSSYGNFDITLLNEEEIRKFKYDELLDFGGIFIGGGNTYKLLKILKETEFDKYLVKLLKETDIPVIGGSAGTVIFGRDIETVETMDINNVGLEDLSGMDMLSGKNIWVHYNESMDEDIQKYIERRGIEVIALPEESGLYVTNDSVQPVGEVKEFR